MHVFFYYIYNILIYYIYLSKHISFTKSKSLSVYYSGTCVSSLKAIASTSLQVRTHRFSPHPFLLTTQSFIMWLGHHWFDSSCTEEWVTASSQSRRALELPLLPGLGNVCDCRLSFLFLERLLLRWALVRWQREKRFCFVSTDLCHQAASCHWGSHADEKGQSSPLGRERLITES